MKTETEFQLQEFREEESELFGRNGTNTMLSHVEPMNRMLKLINQLESEIMDIKKQDNACGFCMGHGDECEKFASIYCDLRARHDDEFEGDPGEAFGCSQFLPKLGFTKSFNDASKSLIEYLAENHHPHVTAILTSNNAELLEGKESICTDEFIPDYND